MEIFFNTNGVVNYFSPDKSIYLRHAFDDERNEIQVWDAAVLNLEAQGKPSSKPVEVFQLPKEEYEQVKFFFQNYLPRNGMNINATEVWEDRERILRQTAELQKLNQKESDLILREKKVKLVDAEERIAEWEEAQANMKSGFRGPMVVPPGGGNILN